MALDAKMISQAEQVSALTDNSLISVSEGEGQPQKNISFPNLVAEIQGEDSKIATASTMEYVRGLDANGNPIMINKSDLASVVAELIPWYVAINSPNISTKAVAVCRIKKKSAYLAAGFNFRISSYNAPYVTGVIGIQYGIQSISVQKSVTGSLGYLKFLYKEIDGYVYIYITGSNPNLYSASGWDFWTKDSHIDFNIPHDIVDVSSIGGTEF